MLSLELLLRGCSRPASLAALLLFLRRPAPTGTLRSVPPAVQYLWHPCGVCKDISDDVKLFLALTAAPQGSGST